MDLFQRGTHAREFELFALVVVVVGKRKLLPKLIAQLSSTMGVDFGFTCALFKVVLVLKIGFDGNLSKEDV